VARAILVTAGICTQITRVSQMKKLTAEFLLRLALLVALALLVVQAMAADVPAKPARYFNDYASLIDSQTAEKLDQRLQDFERQTSNQILVVI
jgi:uncharacterized membrane protein YgcG